MSAANGPKYAEPCVSSGTAAFSGRLDGLLLEARQGQPKLASTSIQCTTTLPPASLLLLFPLPLLLPLLLLLRLLRLLLLLLLLLLIAVLLEGALQA